MKKIFALYAIIFTLCAIQLNVNAQTRPYDENRNVRFNGWTLYNKISTFVDSSLFLSDVRITGAFRNTYSGFSLLNIGTSAGISFTSSPAIYSVGIQKSTDTTAGIAYYSGTGTSHSIAVNYNQARMKFLRTASLGNYFVIKKDSAYIKMNNNIAILWDTTGTCMIGTNQSSGLLNLSNGLGGIRMFDASLSHGMTTILPDNCSMSIQQQTSSSGGLSITTLSSATNGGLKLISYNAGGVNSTVSNINLVGGKKSGTGVTPQTATGYLLTLFNYTTKVFDVMGNGNFIINGQNYAGNFSVSRKTSSGTGNDFTITAGGAFATGSDLAGGKVQITPGISTGTGFQSIRLQRYSRSSTTGSADNTASDAFIIPSSKMCQDNVSTTLFNITCTAGNSFSVSLEYTIKTIGGAGNESHTESGLIYILGSNDGSITVNVAPQISVQHLSDAGTYTVTFAATTANPSVISVTADSGLNVASMISYTIINTDNQIISQL